MLLRSARSRCGRAGWDVCGSVELSGLGVFLGLALRWLTDGLQSMCSPSSWQVDMDSYGQESPGEGQAEAVVPQGLRAAPDPKVS